MANNVTFTKSAPASSANNIAVSQSPGAGAIILNGSTVTNGVATIDTASATNSAAGLRVLITSGSSDAGINFTVNGTNASGSTISDTFAGGATTAQSNLDFVTVTSVTHTGSVASTITIGTSGVGSSPWQTMNWQNSAPMNISVAVELVSGAATYTVQYTYDDPNNLVAGVVFPLALSLLTPSALGGPSTPAAATADGLFNFPLIAVRLLINSGTGALRARIVQSGIG